jgi:hypothetical protein
MYTCGACEAWWSLLTHSLDRSDIDCGQCVCMLARQATQIKQSTHLSAACRSGRPSHPSRRRRRLGYLDNHKAFSRAVATASSCLSSTSGWPEHFEFDDGNGMQWPVAPGAVAHASIALSVRVLVQLLSKMMVFSADPRVSSALSQCHEHTRVCRWPAHKSGISATVSTHAHAQSYLRCCVCAIACAISYQKLEPLQVQSKA